MENENVKILKWTSRTGRQYITLIIPVEGVKNWLQPEKADICIDTGIAYCRSIEWAIIARKWARENGIGPIRVKLDLLRDPNAPKRRRGLVKGSAQARAWGRRMRAMRKKKRLSRTSR